MKRNIISLLTVLIFFQFSKLIRSKTKKINSKIYIKVKSLHLSIFVI